MKNTFKFILLCVIAFKAVAADTVHDFANQLNAMTSMQADFRQTIYDNKGKVAQQSYGQMAFSRPGKFRWHVKKPIPQLIIANDTKLWIYDPDLRQVIIRSLDRAVGETPALLLSHVNAGIERDFNIKKMTQGPSKGAWYQLTPRKKDSMFASIQMGFVQQNISEMRLEDQLGHRTKIVFINPKMNQHIPAQTYLFKPPAKVDTIDETRKR